MSCQLATYWQAWLRFLGEVDWQLIPRDYGLKYHKTMHELLFLGPTRLLLGTVPDGDAFDWTTGLYILFAFFLVLLNGFFVLAEFAIVKVRASRIEELFRNGNARAAAAKEVIADLDNYLAITQLGITIASLALGWIGEPAFAKLVGLVFGQTGLSKATTHTLSSATAFLVITFLHILIGELAPKSLAIRRPEECVLTVARPMKVFYFLLYLPMMVLNGASNAFLKFVGLEAAPHEVTHTEQELRMLLTTAQTSGGFSLNRLLIVENIFDLGGQTVREAMIPWSQVQWISKTSPRTEIMRSMTETRFSRYPVVDASGIPKQYLLMKDLIVQPTSESDWTKSLRPLPSVAPDENLEITMQKLQGDGANMAVVVANGKPIGIITLEDILEEVVGRIEDEYPRLPRLYLKDALASGGIVLDVQAQTPEEAIREMAAVIPADNVPGGINIALLALAREKQMPTDVGNGVAIPHARCPGLQRSLLVLGRSLEGIVFNQQTEASVRLIFMLVTPAERPQSQVFFLTQLASVANSEFVRERIFRAQSAEEIMQIIAAADPAVTG